MNLGNNKILAFAGRKRSGKGVLSNIIKEKYDGVIVTVANYLKFICCDILNCTLDELNQKKDNGTTFSLYPDERWFKIISGKTGIDVKLIENDLSGINFTNVRQMLQVIGTDCIRKHNPDWHVNCMIKDIKSYISNGKTVAVDDVRFPNERKAIEELGGECFFIIRPINANISNHISETALTWNMFDEKHIIINEDTLNEFKENFEWHLDNNFAENKIHSLFLSEKFHYSDMNILFGQFQNEIVNEIISQNKNYGPFIRSGVIRFSASTTEIHRWFLNSIYRKNCKNDINSDTYYIVYNPLINENLKIYL
jgi:hypothetical protein